MIFHDVQFFKFIEIEINVVQNDSLTQRSIMSKVMENSKKSDGVNPDLNDRFTGVTLRTRMSQAFSLDLQPGQHGNSLYNEFVHSR